MPPRRRAVSPLIRSSHEAAVRCGATSGRVLEMLRTLGAPWPDRRAWPISEAPTPSQFASRPCEPITILTRQSPDLVDRCWSRRRADAYGAHFQTSIQLRRTSEHFPVMPTIQGGLHGSSIVSYGDYACSRWNCSAENRPCSVIKDLRTGARRLARRLVLEQGHVDFAGTRSHGGDTDANWARRALAFAFEVD